MTKSIGACSSPTHVQLADVCERFPAGYRWSDNTLVDIADHYHVWNLAEVLNRAAQIDNGDRYLNQRELERAAAGLAKKWLSSFRWKKDEVARIAGETPGILPLAILGAAASQDGGNHVLDASELRAGARALRDAPSASWRGGLDSMRQTHSALHGYRWVETEVDRVMRCYGIADARALLARATAYADATKELGTKELTAAAETMVTYPRAVRWSPRVLSAVMAAHAVYQQNAVLHVAADAHGAGYLDAISLTKAAATVSELANPPTVATINDQLSRLAGLAGASVEQLGKVEGLAINALHLPAPEPKRSALRVVITAGVHGNEPCGPGAALHLLSRLIAHPELRSGLDITLVPLVNPTGLARHTRQNAKEVDLNRKFTSLRQAPAEVKALRKILDAGPYDLVLDLHGGTAGKTGFWVLHRDADAVVGPAVARFAKIWPVLDCNCTQYSLSAPGVGASANPRTLKDYAREHGARAAMTIEAPRSLSYADQVIGEADLCLELLSQAKQS